MKQAKQFILHLLEALLIKAPTGNSELNLKCLGLEPEKEHSTDLEKVLLSTRKTIMFKPIILRKKNQVLE